MDNKSFCLTVAAMTKQMNYMKLNGFPGLCNDVADIVESSSFLHWDKTSLESLSENDFEYGPKCEELVITLPYAGTNFTVRLFFNLHEPWIPPDMNFSDSRFMKKVSVKDLEEMVPSLDNWNYLSEDIIAQLLLQLHQLYKKYQLECLESEELLQFEYQTVLQSLEIGEDDVEVSLSGGNNWLVSLMIRLPLSLKDVPPVLLNGNPGTPTCLLHVSIRKSNGSFTPKLRLSPEVEALIGGAKTLGLPTVPPGSSLSDYITNVLHLLETHVKNSVLAFEMRKQLIVQLLCHYGSALLEYDADRFSQATFLFDVNDFHFILLVEVPENAPKALPQLTLRSIYHCNDRGPIKRELIDLRVPQQSSPENIIEAIKEAVMKAIPDFKSYSSSNGK